MNERQAWMADHQELAATARMLYDVNVLLPSAESVFDFLDKPWKWQGERDAWVAAGRPSTTDPGWELFECRIGRMTDGQ